MSLELRLDVILALAIAAPIRSMVSSTRTGSLAARSATWASRIVRSTFGVILFVVPALVVIVEEDVSPFFLRRLKRPLEPSTSEQQASAVTR